MLTPTVIRQDGELREGYGQTFVVTSNTDWTTRALISEDGETRTYEVHDDDGQVIGTDVEPVTVPDDGPTIDDAVQAASKATTIAALKAAVLTLAAAVEATA